jgi:hypothetical protein
MLEKFAPEGTTRRKGQQEYNGYVMDSQLQVTSRLGFPEMPTSSNGRPITAQE